MKDLSMSLIIRIATQNQIDPNLVAAIVLQESAGIAETQRYEPAYKYFFRPEDSARMLGISLDTEKVGQATSYGLMQVMGGVCRERGFKGYFALLFDPETNLTYGCKHLKAFLERFKNIEDAIASYNAGSPRRDPTTGRYSNQSYVDSVLVKKEKLDRGSNGA